MPELPEVEIVRRGLAEIFASRPQLVRIELLRRDLRDPMPVKKLKALEGAQILAVHRRAKYLLIETDRGGLLSHLGMTGTWRVAPLGQELLHDHIYLHLSTGERLAYRDPRRFGIFETYDVLQPTRSPRLENLGPEPLDREFSGASLWNSLRNRKSSIKAAIMDQKIVVGVGNIYASEALFLARIKPSLAADKLSRLRAEGLVENIVAVLQSALAAGGSSISDFRNSQGDSGYFQNQFKVYDRQTQACVVCNSKIKAQTLAGRSTFWCPRCQRV